jgi:hypothetical protein
MFQPQETASAKVPRHSMLGMFEDYQGRQCRGRGVREGEKGQKDQKADHTAWCPWKVFSCNLSEIGEEK